jgi:ribosomal protein S18 acetylase RimI-like enzyme
MPLITRPARLEDINILLQFEQGVIAAERPFDPTLKKEQIRYYDLEFLIMSEHATLMVAEWDGVIVGSGYVKIMPAENYLSHERYGYIGFIYVEPARRGQGVVDAILTALRKWAEAQDIHEIRLEVYSQNQRAIRAYEKAGFKQHMMVMRFDRNAT